MKKFSKYLSWFQGTKFTEFEIVQLWNSFQQDFPKGRVNRQQLTQLIKKVFPKSLPEVVLDNIFRIFDPNLSGCIRFTDLLIAFSMSMKGTGESQRHYAVISLCFSVIMIFHAWHYSLRIYLPLILAFYSSYRKTSLGIQVIRQRWKWNYWPGRNGGDLHKVVHVSKCGKTSGARGGF